jgi:hypothetical protein
LFWEIWPLKIHGIHWTQKYTLTIAILTLLSLAHFHCQAHQSSSRRKLHPGRLSGDRRTWWTSLADLMENNP